MASTHISLSPVGETLTLTAQTPPPLPTRFTKNQKAFLEKILPQFCAYISELKGTGPRGVKGVKGEQKKWVETNVLKMFVDNFGEPEENKDVLFNVRTLLKLPIYS